MSEPLKTTKVVTHRPHQPFGQHADIITPLPDIRGTDKIRIGTDGKILTEDVLTKGGFKTTITDNTK